MPLIMKRLTGRRPVEVTAGKAVVMTKPQISALQDENAFPQKYTPGGQRLHLKGGCLSKTQCKGRRESLLRIEGVGEGWGQTGLEIAVRSIH